MFTRTIINNFNILHAKYNVYQTGQLVTKYIYMYNFPLPTTCVHVHAPSQLYKAYYFAHISIFLLTIRNKPQSHLPLLLLQSQQSQ